MLGIYLNTVLELHGLSVTTVKHFDYYAENRFYTVDIGRREHQIKRYRVFVIHKLCHTEI